MDTTDMIKITDLDLVEFAKAIYAASSPQGLGLFHFQEGGLSNEDAKALVDRGNKHFPLRMDYVRGRSCKTTVFRDDADDLWVDKRWLDHPDGLREQIVSDLRRKVA